MSSSEWSNICLIINALLWTTTFVLYQYKTRYFGVGSGIMLLYTIISIVAIHYYNSEYTYRYEDVTLFPFIYLFIMILLSCYPILSIKESQIKYIEAPNSSLFKFVCYTIIISSLISIPETVALLKENLVNIIIDTTTGQELYHESTETMAAKTESAMNISGVIFSLFKVLSLPCFIYYITCKNKNTFLLIGLLISSLIHPLETILVGSRFPIALFFTNIIFSLIFIRRMLPQRTKKVIITFLGILILFLVVPFVAITASKAQGDTETALLSVEQYGAEGFIYFNNYGLDAGGTRNGDYTAAVFKRLLGMKTAMYYTGRINKYAHMKLNESQFYTYVGDFTLDYGPIFTIPIFIVTSLFFKRCLKIRKGIMTFPQFLMFYLLMVGCLGYFQFPLGRESGNVQIIGTVLFALLFKFVDDYRRNKVNNQNQKYVHDFHSNGDV